MDPITKDEFLDICRQAEYDARSIDPATLLFEILVRVRRAAGDDDPRTTIKPSGDLQLGDSYRVQIEECVREELGGDFDVAETLYDFVRKSTKDMQR